MFLKSLERWNKRGIKKKKKGPIVAFPLKRPTHTMLPRPADSNRPIVVKLKRGLEYSDYAYFEPVRPLFKHQALDYLNLRNNFYEYISISKGLPSNKIIGVP